MARHVPRGRCKGHTCIWTTRAQPTGLSTVCNVVVQCATVRSRDDGKAGKPQTVAQQPLAGVRSRDDGSHQWRSIQLQGARATHIILIIPMTKTASATQGAIAPLTQQADAAATATAPAITPLSLQREPPAQQRKAAAKFIAAVRAPPTQEQRATSTATSAAKTTLARQRLDSAAAAAVQNPPRRR